MRKWKLPWIKKKNPITPKPPRYDSVYSFGSKKGSWLKEQGAETLKNLPRTVIQAGVGAAVMTGLGAAVQPDQVAQGNDSSNKKNSAVFLYDASQSKGLTYSRLQRWFWFFVLIVVVSPLVIMSVKQFMYICTCKWAKPNQERRNDHYTEDNEMEGFRGFNIKNIVSDVETRETLRTWLPRKDIQETVSEALNMMDRKALTIPEEGNMDNTN